LFGVTLDASGVGGPLLSRRTEPVADVSHVGRRLGRYHVISRLGAGSMGVVYAARDPGLDRVVALKLLPPLDPERREHLEARLRREAQALARLDHPNVVPVHDIGAAGDGMFVVMRLVDGESLADRIASTRTTRAQLLELFVAAGRGLAAAHDAGIVHRDFKPANVLVDARDRVFVVDFGLACSGDDIDPCEYELGPAFDCMTVDGGVVGTPYFMSPEQHRGEPATARSDQFAFAVSLWTALFHHHPFGAHTPESHRALARMRADQVIPPRKHAGVPRRVIRALRRALRHDPDARWPSMTALLAELAPRTRRSTLKLVIAAAVLAGLWANALARPHGAPPAAASPRLTAWPAPPRAAAAPARRAP
jgi:serine/threonine protein kinase